MKTKKPFYSKKYFFPAFILIATLFMSVGYAAVNSVILSISGTAVAKVEEVTGVYISDAYIDYGIGNGVEENSKITQLYQTNFSSTVVLDATSRWSYLYFVITVYNSTDDDYQYVGPEYVEGESTYDNPGIVLTVSNITQGYILKSKESVTFNVLFSYKNYVISGSNILNSIINFKFESLAEGDDDDDIEDDDGKDDGKDDENENENEEILTSAGFLNSSSTDGNIFGGNLNKYDIEYINFVKHENVPAGAVSWDASANNDGSITGWYVDSDGNGLYELYIGADTGRITLPANCNKLFYYYTSLKNIDFSNIDTSQVTNMSEMFYYSYNLTELDLSKFDMSNVTSTFYMFYLDYKLQVIRFDNASFDSVTSYSYMFDQVSGVVVVKDEAAKNWMLTYPLRYNNYGATVKTVDEYEG